MYADQPASSDLESTPVPSESRCSSFRTSAQPPTVTQTDMPAKTERTPMNTTFQMNAHVSMTFETVPKTRPQVNAFQHPTPVSRSFPQTAPPNGFNDAPKILVAASTWLP